MRLAIAPDRGDLGRVVDVPLVVFIMVLCISLSGLGWAIIPLQPSLLLSARYQVSAAAQCGPGIEVAIAGGANATTRADPNGRFSVRLPRGALSAIKIIADGRVEMIIEVRDRNVPYSCSVDLGNLRWSNHCGQVVIRRDGPVQITYGQDLMNHAPTEHQLFDGYWHGVHRQCKAG